jgi:hypothetical protein
MGEEVVAGRSGFHGCQPLDKIVEGGSHRRAFKRSA